jgi:hypothetical protein
LSPDSAVAIDRKRQAQSRRSRVDDQGFTVIRSLTTTPTWAVLASSTARDRTVSDSTVPDNVTSFFVTSARTLSFALRTCSSRSNIVLTASSSLEFAAFGLPGPIGDAA